MKLKWLFLFSLGLLLCNCSKDDSGSNAEIVTVTLESLPVTGALTNFVQCEIPLYPRLADRQTRRKGSHPFA